MGRRGLGVEVVLPMVWWGLGSWSTYLHSPCAYGGRGVWPGPQGWSGWEQCSCRQEAGLDPTLWARTLKVPPGDLHCVPCAVPEASGLYSVQATSSMASF